MVLTHGSIKDPYYQYATLKFYPSSSDTSTTASIYLPFFNGEWWSVMFNGMEEVILIYILEIVYTEIIMLLIRYIMVKMDNFNTGYFAISCFSRQALGGMI